MTYRHTRIAAHLGMATQAVAINLPALLFVVFHDELGASTAALPLGLKAALLAALLFPLSMLFLVRRASSRVG